MFRPVDVEEEDKNLVTHFAFKQQCFSGLAYTEKYSKAFYHYLKRKEMEIGMKINKYSRISSNSHSQLIFTLKSSSREVFKFRKHSRHNKQVRDTAKYTSPDYRSNELLAVWDELRKKNQLCDGIIKSSNGTVFHIHRAILSAFSPFFRAFFTNTMGLHEGKEEINEMHLKDISSEVIKLILDFVYTGHCAVDKTNVERLLPAADRLECVDIVKICSEFLIGELCTENCLGIFRFSRYYSCKELQTETRNFIRADCVKIFNNNPEFEELSWEDVYDILSDDYLNVPREELVYEAVDRWISKSPGDRQRHVYTLFQCIRFGLMEKDYFEDNVKLNRYLNEETYELLRTVENVKNEYMPGMHCDKIFMRPRIPYEVLFTVGGWSKGSPITVVETYDSRANKWFKIEYEDSTPRAYHGLACLNNLIYMIGGFDGNVYFNTVRCFDPVRKTWSEKACMHYTRCYASIAIYEGEIYVMGGFNGANRMSFAEKYNPKKNQWQLIQAMNSPRSDASAATLDDKIYIVGGFNGLDVLMSAEVYNPSTGQWTTITAMSTPRSGVSLIAYKDCLYAIGGYDGLDRLSSVEKYNPLKEMWQTSPNMLLARSNFACIVIEDFVFVIGGFDGTTTICDTEFYCEEEDGKGCWKEGTPMNVNRSALSACICRGLPNSYDYSLAAR